jgi:hypothetical protein
MERGRGGEEPSSLCNRTGRAFPVYAGIRNRPRPIDFYHQRMILPCYRFHTAVWKRPHQPTQPALSGNSRWVFPASDPVAGGRPESGHDPSKAAQERMAIQHERASLRQVWGCGIAGGWLPRCASSSRQVVARDRRVATRVVPRENGQMSGSRPSVGTGAVCLTADVPASERSRFREGTGHGNRRPATPDHSI